MSRAARQKRWRDNSGKQRVEVYLPTHIVARLDTMEGSRAEAIAALVQAAKSSTSSQPAYRFRKPKQGESSADWLIVVDGEPWAEIERYQPGYPKRTCWRARTIKRSLTWKWCEGTSRGDVAARLFDKPDIWQ